MTDNQLRATKIPEIASNPVKNKTAPSRWADKRLGFKHELILTLRDDGFTHREAEALVEQIFASISASLMRRENVIVENFGSWTIEERDARKRRAWRFSKVVTLKRYKVIFRMEDDALLFAHDPAWKPHASWAEAERRPQKLSRKKREELARKQEQERIWALYLKYVRAIVRFFAYSLAGEDWDMFWAWRWNTPWYKNEFERHCPSAEGLYSIDDVSIVIKETTPVALDRQWSNRVIDTLEWYARWTAQLDVDHHLWDLAERDAREYLKSGNRWGQLLAPSAHL